VPQALTADAKVVQGPGANADEDRVTDPRRRLYRTPDVWQREVWDFYDSLGEFRQGITWKANMLSRVRLVAAKKVQGVDEPQRQDTGPAADIVANLAGGIGGQSSLMRGFAVYVSAPGECYLIGETQPDGTNKWYIRSIEEVRPSSFDPSIMSVAQPYGRWRDLPDNSIVVRVWRPHHRWHAVADSSARAARPLLRELELINRHIAAQYMSRLASAGIVVFPDEITFPVRPEFADEPDPFVAEWIEIAAEAIKTPGTASAVIPIPIKVPGEFVDKVRHIDFTLRLDDQIINKRDSTLSRLAISLDMPPEALLGTKDVNHWNAWLIDEQGVKIHVAPDVEIICDALTTGYLKPMLDAAGEDPEDWVVWYDASELILRPDRSENAKDAYDRLEINGDALRRETGFSDLDKPGDDDLRRMILLKTATEPVNAFAAMDELGLEVTHDTPPTAPRPPAEPPPDNPPPTDKNPPAPQPQRDVQPPKSRGITEQLAHQATLTHGLKIEFDGWTILHPHDCVDHMFSCPMTHAMWKPAVGALPGSSGTYRCWLNATGAPVIGERIYNGDAADMHPSKKHHTAMAGISGA
jgi:hypothetical protein